MSVIALAKLYTTTNRQSTDKRDSSVGSRVERTRSWSLHSYRPLDVDGDLRKSVSRRGLPLTARYLADLQDEALSSRALAHSM